MARLRISNTWDGALLKPSEVVEIEPFVAGDKLVILVDAPFYGDKAPSAPIGSTDRLWEYEVVELFLLGEDSRYLEVELGPHGHYLALELWGVRRVVRKGLPIEYRTEIVGDRWRGVAEIPRSYLPPNVERANAYAIHGEKGSRRYLAAVPVAGAAPDFHRLEAFGPLELAEDRGGRNKGKGALTSALRSVEWVPGAHEVIRGVPVHRKSTQSAQREQRKILVISFGLLCLISAFSALSAVNGDTVGGEKQPGAKKETKGTAADEWNEANDWTASAP